MSNGFAGGCLCGAVRYESAVAPLLAGHCHCTDCRKTSATGHATHVVVPSTAFTVSGEVRFFDRPADSGNVVSRGFCPQCGSALYSTNAQSHDMIFVRASSLDDPDIITPAASVYVSRAPKWDLVAPDLPAFPEMPPGGPRAMIDQNR